MAKKKGARHMREWSAGDMKKLRQFAKSEGVGARRGTEAGSVAGCGPLQGHDGGRFVPLHQSQALIGGHCSSLAASSSHSRWALR